MEKRKNIIYITGIDTYGVRREKDRWKKLFRERQGSENIEEIRIEEIKDWSRIEQDIQALGLFAEKRLWSFSGGVKKKKKDEGVPEEGEEKKKGNEIEKRLLSMIEGVNDDQILIFSSLTFDPEKGLIIPWLQRYAEVKKFDTLWSSDIWGLRFNTLDIRTIEKVLKLYKEAEDTKEDVSMTVSDAIGGTLEKLALLGSSTHISDEVIDASLDRSFSGKMFDLTDALLAKNITKSLQIFTRVCESTTMYEFLPSLLGALRNALYIKYLAHMGTGESEISSTIRVHPFVLKKTLTSRITYSEMATLYKNLLDANIAYKSGGGLKDPELGRIFHIERAILGLKK